MKIIYFPILLLTLISTTQAAQLRITRATSPIVIDGILDETAWQNALKFGLEFETKPGENIPASIETECFMVYDSDAIYVAFRAHDAKPSEIRAHYTDRDQIFQDDFIGLALDTFHDNRRAFEFFVNPFGVQMDLFNDDVARVEDGTWDTIWSSAGKITEQGYEVEMMIPFRSLRFPTTGAEQSWGIDVLRYYPRDQTYRYGLHPQDRNKNCYLCQDSSISGFEGISIGRNLELDPTFTSSNNEERPDFPNGDFENDWKADPGLTVGWGFTPNWTANLALNPDFSQVEADAAQLNVNEQFALFFPEKRPFFLEGADLFTTPLQAVFTRNVADPIAGGKLSGKQGSNVFAGFFSRDEITNLIFPGSEESDATSLHLDSNDSAIRYRRDIGTNSAVGLLFTDREAKEYFNRLAGVDANFRFAESNQFRFQWMGSNTQYPQDVSAQFHQPQDAFGDQALHVGFIHEDRNWLGYARFQSIGTDFRADMGFMPQVDYKLYLLGGGYTWQGDATKWYNRFFVGSDWDQTEDQTGNLIERELEFFVEWNGVKQSFVSLDGGTRKRAFHGVSFDQKFFNFAFESTPISSLYVRVDGSLGDHLDVENVRDGDIVRFIPFFRYRASRHLAFELRHTYESLDVTGGNLYQANLSEGRVVYQFNVRTFIRVITQYLDVQRNTVLYIDPVKALEKNWFNQILFSYKLNPQTVFFLGYSDNHFGEENLELTQKSRTVFLKIGYAFRL